MKIIVAGCGRVGLHLATALAREGHSVTVIDPDPTALEQVTTQCTTLSGVVFDRDVLLKAGIERADGLAAVTASDNANIVTARIAKMIYRVPQVVARLYEPGRADIYRKLGLQTICSTTWGVGRIMQLLTHSRLGAVLEMGSGEVSVVEFEVGARLVGRSVQELNVSTEIKVISITRAGRAFIPGGSTPLNAGDRVHVAITKSALSRFEALVEG